MAQKATVGSNPTSTANFMEKSDMANLPESIPYQPIEEDTEEKSRYWVERALPLVRKVFADLEKKKEKSGTVG